MTFSSIDPREMHRLGQGVQEAGKALAGCAGQLRAILAEVQVNHPGVAAIDQAARWLTDQAPDLYRRRDLAYEAEKVDTDVFGNPTVAAAVPAGLIAIDEGRLIPADVRAAAHQAAALIPAAGRGDKHALAKLAAFRGRMSDPRFATALLEKLGPQALTTLPVEMSARVRQALDQDPERARAMREQNRDLLSMLGAALAHATVAKGGTPRLSDRFLDTLKKQGRKETEAPGMGGLTAPGYWALGQVLAASPEEPYSSWFMRTVGRDMIRWDRDHLKEHGVRFLPRDTDVYNLPAPIDSQPFQDTDQVGAADPIAALMTAAGRAREPAQALLADRDLLTYVMHDRRPQWAMGDHGESLGHAMEAAMTGQDDLSKTLAVTASQIYADDVKPQVSVAENGDIEFSDPSNLDFLSGVRDNMARILSANAHDMVTSHYKNYGRLPDGELTGNVDGRAVARFSPVDLDLVLLDVASDDVGYGALLNGEIAHMRIRVDEAIAARNEDKLANVITSDSKALGHLLEARRQSLIARGKEADAVDAVFKKLVDEGIGLVPVPFADKAAKMGLEAAKGIYEGFVKDGYAKAGDWLAKQAEHAGGNTVKSHGEAASNQKAAEELVKQMLESSSVAHGYHDHGNLKGPFVVGDPPKVKPPFEMNKDEYDAFVEWMEDNAKVPKQYGDAQLNTKSGMDEFKVNVGAMPPKEERDE